MSVQTKHSGWWALPLSLSMIVAISVGLMLVLKLFGVPFMPVAKTEIVAPTPTPDIVAQLKSSPAWFGLSASLNEPPAGWAASSGLVSSPQSPYPFSCSTDGANPVISFSRGFSVNGRPIQVMTTAYSAGLGEKGMADRFAKLRSCAGNDAYVSTAVLGGLGVESYQINVTKGGVSSKDIMWRHGDIVNYVITQSTNPETYNLATAFQTNMLSKLNGVCVNDNSTESDYGRTPWSGAAFTGLIKDKAVTIQKAGLPVNGQATFGDPTPTATASPTSSTTPSSKPVIVPKQFPLEPAKSDVPDVTVPTQPTAYPVWPLLPASVEKPLEPTSPAANPPFTSTVKEQVEDTVGPGCGWAFTGSVSPLFHADQVKQATDQKVTTEEKRLTEESKKWQVAVLDYWTKYATFKTDLPKWITYVDEVNKVSDAWVVITKSWDTYNANKAIYDQLVKDRNDFIAKQKSTKTDYDKAIEQCKVQDEAKKKSEATPTPSPTPTPTTTATPSAIPTATPTEQPIVCPPVKPSILDEKVPDEPKAPVPPADPRPIDQRK